MFVIVAPTHFELIRRAIQLIEIILVDSQLLWAVVALILYYCVIAVINFFIHMMCLLFYKYSNYVIPVITIRLVHGY